MQPTVPWGRAAVIAGGYVVVASAYIYASSQWAGELGLDAEAQATVETLKGFGFVAVTGLVLLGVLAVQFRRLARVQDALLERTHALGRAERRATTAAVSAAVAHDMKNQLTVALASYAVLSGVELDGDRADARDDLGTSLRRLREMAGELMERANVENGTQLEPVDVSRLARRVARFARFCAKNLERPVVVDAEEGCVVEADERDLEHAALNLILNAVDATDGHGRVTVKVRRDGDQVVLAVCDDGPGVPAELRERIFEPFFTTKSGGTGLGLATTRQVIRRFRGELSVGSKEPRGACFRVGLPAVTR